VKETVPCQLTNPPPRSRVRGKDRMERFGDGVYGFARLLVLDLAVYPPGTPLERMLHAWR
jgi:hypothetical protein